MPKYTKWSCMVLMTLFCSSSITAFTKSSSKILFGTKQHSEQLLEEANQFFEEEAYQAAIDGYLHILAMGEIEQEPQQKTAVWFKLGRCYQKLNQFPDALEFFSRFLSVASQNSEMASKEARVWGYIANIHQKLGNYDRSLDYQLRALSINEKIQDSLGIARSLYDLGTLYFYQKNYEAALQNYEAALEICKAQKNQNAVFSCLAALGSVQSHLENIELALEYNFKSLDLAKQKQLKSQSYALNNIGYNYIKLGDHNCAKWYLSEAIKIQKQAGDKWGQVCTYVNLGELHLKEGKFYAAIQSLQIGLDLGRHIGSKSREVDYFKLLAEAYHKAGYFDASYVAFQKHISIKDSLNNEKNLLKEASLKSAHEIQRREREIKDLKLENEILVRDQEITQLNQKYLWVGTSLLVLTLFFSFIGYRYRHQGKINRQLKAMNEKEKLANRQLEFSNAELKKFAYIASHDLKAPLRSIGSFTGLLKRRYDHLFDQNAKEYMEFIIEGSKRMNQLLDDLLAYSKIEKLAYNKEGIRQSLEEWLDTRSVVSNALHNLSYRINEHQADILVNESALPKLKANQSHMTQLFQNIIDNGIKFKGTARPQISIDCATDAQKHTFSIRDNGIGIAPEYKDKIFGMFNRLHGVDAYEGTGIGLATCKKIIERHGGEIWVESEIGRGSTFYFSIPRASTFS